MIRKSNWLLLWLVLVPAAICAAQAAQAGQAGLRSEPEAKPKPPATILRDHTGTMISDAEFVDIRMANFQDADRTTTRILDDGARELTTAKIPQEGTLAPSFYAKYIDGTPLELGQLKGKVVVLNFWFIGCPACEHEAPRLDTFRAKFMKEPGVVFISMTGDKAEAVKQYLKTHKTSYKVVTDATDALETFDFGGYPKNIVISKEGRIVYWRSTVKAWNKFESVVWTELSKD